MSDQEHKTTKNYITRTLLLLVVLAFAAGADGMMVYSAKIFLEPKPATESVFTSKTPLPQEAIPAQTTPSSAVAAQTPPATPPSTQAATTSPVAMEQKAAEKTAIQETPDKKGIDSEKTAEIVIGNSSSNRYHLPGMKYYDKVNVSHRVEFKSEKEAIKAGYHKAPR